MTDDLKELLDDTHLRRWLTRSPPTPTMTAAHPLWWNSLSDALRTRWTLTADACRPFRERIETAQRVDPTYGAYDDLLAADHVA